MVGGSRAVGYQLLAITRSQGLILVLASKQDWMSDSACYRGLRAYFRKGRSRLQNPERHVLAGSQGSQRAICRVGCRRAI
jgi:hypothetical protein